MVSRRISLRLKIQPVPKGNWGDNLAHLLPKEVWNVLRRSIYSRAGNKCEICGDFTKTLHCHENWWYDDRRKIQTLSSLMSLCRDCHNCIHWFRTEQQAQRGKEYSLEYLEELREHYMKVNSCSLSALRSHLTGATITRQKRSKGEYTIVYGKYSVQNIMKRYRERENEG